MSNRRVFISYRHDDAAGYSVAIYDRLVENLSPGRVFMDILGIEPGSDFVEKLESAVSKCDVLIALIGNRWVGQDSNGRGRIVDPRDWVHVEVATALRRGIKVIPVLLDGARFPSSEQLPNDLQPLVRLNAVDVRNSRLNADVRDLTGAAMSALGERWPPDEPGGKIYAIASATYTLVVGAFMLIILFASMFFDPETEAVIGAILLIINTIILLRLPLLSWVRTLSRQAALRTGAILHLIGFGILSSADKSIDVAMVIMLGVMPAALLFLASFAMRRLVRS